MIVKKVDVLITLPTSVYEVRNNSASVDVTTEDYPFFLASDGKLVKQTGSVYDFFIYLDIQSIGASIDDVPVGQSGYVLNYPVNESQFRFVFVEKLLMASGAARVRLQAQRKLPGQAFVPSRVELPYIVPWTLSVNFLI